MPKVKVKTTSSSWKQGMKHWDGTWGDEDSGGGGGECLLVDPEAHFKVWERRWLKLKSTVQEVVLPDRDWLK